MATKLDLTVFKDTTFELILLNGETIHIRKPSQAFIFKIMDIENDIEKETNNIKLINILSDLVLDILNNNAENVTFSLTDISNYDLTILQAIIQGYSEFINEVMNNPN